MKPGFLRPGELIIPLTLLAFAGPGITLVSGVLSTTTRWAFLLAWSLFLLFFRCRDVTDLLRRPLFWVVMAYASWCFMAAEYPELQLRVLFVSARVSQPWESRWDDGGSEWDMNSESAIMAGAWQHAEL